MPCRWAGMYLCDEIDESPAWLQPMPAVTTPMDAIHLLGGSVVVCRHLTLSHLVWLSVR